MEGEERARDSASPFLPPRLVSASERTFLSPWEERLKTGSPVVPSHDPLFPWWTPRPRHSPTSAPA